MKSNVIKKATALVLLALMAVGGLEVFGATDYAADEIRIRVDGEFIATGDQPPVIVDGRTLVPLRVVMERLGFDVEWVDHSRAANLRKSGLSIHIVIDQLKMTVITPNTASFIDSQVALDVPARIINDRTMVPVRAISEATGMDVNWDGQSRIVDISTGGGITAAPSPTPMPTQLTGNNIPHATAQPPNNNDNRNTPRTVTPVLFEGDNILNMLSSTELSELAATAATPEETRSANVLPNRRPTDAELTVWIEEYRELGGINDFELEVIRLINEYRVQNGLNPLAISMELSMAARFHSQSMADLSFFAHGNPYYRCDASGRSESRATDRAEMFGHVNVQESAWGVTENISGSGSPQGVMQQWLNSQGHRAAMLREGYVSIGIGVVRGGGTTAKFGS